MRSRTELVTTTFIDSEEDDSESDDSEEDWKPDGSKNYKRKHSKNRRNKKKSNNKSSGGTATKRQKFEVATFKEEPPEYSDFDDIEADDDDDDYGKESVNDNENFKNETDSRFDIYQHFSIPSTKSKSDEKLIVNKSEVVSSSNIPLLKSNTLFKEDKPLSQKIVAEQSMPDKSGIFQLYLFKKDLSKDYRTNLQLCLWRRDGSSLLQKYIRIKMPNISENFIFTSSTVYSSWDERRRKDFEIIAVKCLEENNRRVTILNISDLHSLAEAVIKQKELRDYDSPEEYDDDEDSNDVIEYENTYDYSENYDSSAEYEDGDYNSEDKNQIVIKDSQVAKTDRELKEHVTATDNVNYVA